MATPGQPSNAVEHVIFVHIPKAAGTTIRAALAQAYARDERAFIYDPGVPDSVTAATLAGWDRERRARLTLVMGHVAVGIHEVLPGQSRYVTMLREPIERLVSQYYFFKTGTFVPGTAAARQHERLADEDIPLDEYAFETHHPRWDNEMVRLLSGRIDASFGSCDEAMLQLALDNIEERFAGLLLHERMDDSMERLRAITGRDVPSLAPRPRRRDGRWRYLAWLRDRTSRQVAWRNATLGRPPLDEMDEAVLDRMRELNHLDVELYRIARERFRTVEMPA